MKKQEFKNIVNEGLDRDKSIMIIKIKGSRDVNTRLVIIQGEDIKPNYKRYIKETDDNMIFKDSGDRVEDLLMTNNINELSWFIW
jgi:hypothetical protein